MFNISMNIKRCNYIVLDKNTKRNRKCKNKQTFLEFCTNHYNYLYLKNILYIQSKFRGNKVRQKLNNIYYLLPDELQNKIIYHVSEDYYYLKYTNSICKVIDNKLNNLITSQYTRNIIYSTITQPITSYYNNIDIYILDLFNIYYIMNKYSSIILKYTKFKKLNIYLLLKIANILTYSTSFVDEITKFIDIYNEFKYYNYIQLYFSF